MSDIPQITPCRRNAYPSDAILAPPDGVLRRGDLALLDGTPLRIIGHLRSGGRLALFARESWVAVPEHWVERREVVYGDGPG